MVRLVMKGSNAVPKDNHNTAWLSPAALVIEFTPQFVVITEFACEKNKWTVCKQG